MEWKKEMQKAVKGGQVDLGVKQVLKGLRKSEGRLVVVSRDCPEAEEINHYAELAGVPLHVFPGRGFDLGATVKKPFSVSAVLVK